ncbi:MAG: RDD family protein [Steroidobacteraceae bacterium]
MISATSAGFGRRLGALIYDSLLLAALLMMYTAAWVFTRGSALTQDSAGAWWHVYRAGEVVVIAGYYVLNWTRSGQTLGMRAWHLRAVSDSGRPLRLVPAVLRSLYAPLAWAPAALGVLWLYIDPERLALHDRLSKTRVLHLAGRT